jgi:hypothetical protein
MKIQLQSLSRRTVAGISLLALTLFPFVAFSQVQLPPPPIAVDDGQQAPIPVMSPNQLDGLVAPIALYPDPLISQILVAATYPLEVVEAYQWIQRNPGLTGPALTQAAAEQNWDPAVQALVVFPDVLKRLNEDVNWTTNLGNAFLNQQADVMGAIQRMRQSAEQSGRLVTTPQEQVINTVDAGQPVVEILPANPEVIYVPVYDPAWVWGPPVYYPYAHWYYPPYRSGIFFNIGISIGGFFGHGWGGWGGWGWHPAWGSRTIVVNNTFINRYNFNSTHIANVRGPSVWTHDAFHRQGVPYPNQALNRRYEGNVRSNFVAPPRGQAPAQFQGREAAREQARAFAPSRPTMNEPARSAIRENWNARAETRSFTPAPAPAPAPRTPSEVRSFAPRGGGNAFMSAPSRQERGNFNAAPDRSFQSAPRMPSQARSFEPRGGGNSFAAAPRQQSSHESSGGHESSGRHESSHGQGGHSHR